MTDGFILLFWGFGLANCIGIVVAALVDVRLKRQWFIRIPVNFVVWASFVVVLTIPLTRLLAERWQRQMPRDPEAALCTQFDEAAVPQKIAIANVIAVTKTHWQKGRVGAYVTEILKQAPEAKFPYRVGDEYVTEPDLPSLGGDGQLIFVVGNRGCGARLAISGDRIPQFNDMSMDEFRAEVARRP